MIVDFTAVDIESTGLGAYKERIIEIGAVKYRNGKAVDKFSSLVNSGMEIPERITELTGISNEMVKSAPDEESVIKDFLKFVGEDIILGHNVSFDYGFLKMSALRYGCDFNAQVIDTLQLARNFHSEFESRTLESMCRYYGIINKNAHRAYDDAAAAAELYFKLADNFYDRGEDSFKPGQAAFKIKKNQPATAKQIKYLKDLLANSETAYSPDYETLTKSEASRIIDRIKSKGISEKS